MAEQLRKRRGEGGTSGKEGNQWNASCLEAKIKSDEVRNKGRQEDSEMKDDYKKVWAWHEIGPEEKDNMSRGEQRKQRRGEERVEWKGENGEN